MSRVRRQFATSSTKGWCVWGVGLAVLAFSCEPDWDELTSEASAARGGSASGSSGSSATAGGVDQSDGGTSFTGGSGAAGGQPAGAAGETSGAGGGGSPAIVTEAIDLPGTATADSEEASKGNLAVNGHDGDNLTRWVAADGALGHNWTLDLGSPHSLARVTIRWEYPHGVESAVSYLYTVSVSNDGVVYEVVLDKSDNTETTQDQVAELPPGTTGRYARITVTGLPAANPEVYWASFYEARVFGFPAQ